MHCYIINEEKDAYKGKEQGSKMDYKKAGVDIEAGYKSVSAGRPWRIFRGIFPFGDEKYGESYPCVRNGRCGDEAEAGLFAG